MGIQLQNCQNLEFCPRICPSGATRLHNFYAILSVCTRLYVPCKFLVWSLSGDKQPSIFPLWGIELSQLLCRDDSTIVLVIIIIIIIIFPQIFNSPRGETTDRIKKVRGAKMGRISSISMPSMVGILGRAPAVDEKCDFFCFFCHALELRSL